LSEPRPSELVSTLPEAVAFYAQNLAGARTITCSDKRVTIVFERDATHLFSESCADSTALDASEVVERTIPAGQGRTRREVRRFSVTRARLMSYVLPAISCFAVSVPESGGRQDHQKRVLYGPPLPGSRSRLRVVLRPGPGDAFTVVSAYPVDEVEFVKACRLKRAKFPP
jgi:hypothetical protein